jgi:hypothetical protein
MGFEDEAQQSFKRHCSLKSPAVSKSPENLGRPPNPALACHDEAMMSVAEDWQQSLTRERWDWVYTCDATAYRH